MDEFVVRLAKLVAVEDEKTALVQDLIDRVKSLECSLSDAQRQLKRALDVTDMYQQKNEQKGVDLLKMQQNLDQMSYVAVLIDGDCMPFVDELLAAGELGGRQAARLLKASVVEYLRSKHPEIPANVKVTMRVYANLGGLARAYYDAKLLGNPAELSIFVNGFNKEDALCDLVNAGDGKECADEKLKAAFQMSFDNVQCRHIIFGGSPDNGYARLLGPHADSKKVSLLEGPPFAKELAELATRYPVMDCAAVFRKTRLIRQRPEADVAYVQSVTPAKPAASIGTTAASDKSFQSNSKAKAVKTVTTTDWNAISSPSGIGVIARNAAGHRIDTPVPYSSAEVKAMKLKKLCNVFHILGHCPHENRCSFKHGRKIAHRSVEALINVSRMSNCPSGLGCCVENCVLGHRCPKDPCRLGKTCYFPQAMHRVDTRIVSWKMGSITHWI